MPEIWFKNKKYGYGWVPANTKGWLVLLGYIISIKAYGFIFLRSSNGWNLVWFFVCMTISTISLIVICKKKGEKPKWQWGEKDKQQ